MAFLGEIALTRRRFAATTYAAGRAVAGAATDTAFLGSLQPLRGRDRQVLPEGLRSYDGRKVYAPIGTLRTEDQHAGLPADQVLYGAVAFTVAHVDDDHREISHDRAFLVRLQEGT
jgi:hypothetical protein